MANVADQGDFYSTPIANIAASTLDTTVSDVIPVPAGATECKVGGRATVAVPDDDADVAYTIVKKLKGQTVFSSTDNGSVHRTGQGASAANGNPSNIDCSNVIEMKVVTVQNTNSGGAITNVSLPFSFVTPPGGLQ